MTTYRAKLHSSASRENRNFTMYQKKLPPCSPGTYCRHTRQSIRPHG